MNLTPWLLIALMAPLPQTPPQQAAPPQGTPQQTPPSAAPAQTRVEIRPEDLPVSLERIQRALAETPKLRLKSDKPVFTVEIFGKKPTIEDILGPDFYKGPVQYGSMTHQEFLKMVTPEDVQGYAAFTNREGATVAATSFLLQWTLQKAMQKFKEARADREREEARKEVLDALAELEKARARAGLPPK
jgi:hypothetical protein